MEKIPIYYLFLTYFTAAFRLVFLKGVYMNLYRLAMGPPNIWLLKAFIHLIIIRIVKNVYLEEKIPFLRRGYMKNSSLKEKEAREYKCMIAEYTLLLALNYTTEFGLLSTLIFSIIGVATAIGIWELSEILKKDWISYLYLVPMVITIISGLINSNINTYENLKPNAFIATFNHNMKLPDGKLVPVEGFRSAENISYTYSDGEKYMMVVGYKTRPELINLFLEKKNPNMRFKIENYYDSLPAAGNFHCSFFVISLIAMVLIVFAGWIYANKTYNRKKRSKTKKLSFFISTAILACAIIKAIAVLTIILNTRRLSAADMRRVEMLRTLHRRTFSYWWCESALLRK